MAYTIHPVYCLNCGTGQEWENSTWSMNGQSIVVHFVCTECKFWVEAKAQSFDQVMQNLGMNPRKALFEKGQFKLHSGAEVDYKIECDALTDQDIEAIALMMSRILPPFSSTIGVPTGGIRLAAALDQYKTVGGCRLIVDDVLTTGASMEDVKGDLSMPVIGAVIFARGACPNWITPLFRMTEPA